MRPVLAHHCIATAETDAGASVPRRRSSGTDSAALVIRCPLPRRPNPRLQPRQTVLPARAEIENPLQRAAGFDQQPAELGALGHERPVVRIVAAVGGMGDLVDVRRHPGELPVDLPKRRNRRRVDLQEATDPPCCDPKRTVPVEVESLDLGVQLGELRLGETHRDHPTARGAFAVFSTSRLLHIAPASADHAALDGRPRLVRGGRPLLFASGGGVGVHAQMLYT